MASADGTDVGAPTLPELQELYREVDFTELGGGILGGLMGFDWSPNSDAIVASFDVSICKDFVPQPALHGLYILKLDGSPEEKLADGAHSPAWSPSGRYIAYGGIHLLDLTSREVIDLTEGSQPAWRPLP